MKSLIVTFVFLSFIMGQSSAQSLNTLIQPFSDKKLSATIDTSYLTFKGNLDFNKVLKNPAENKTPLLKLALQDRIGMEGFVTSSPLDNMPVIRPSGNFPNRNFLPDPTQHYPMRIQRLDYMHTLTLDK